MSLQPPRNDEHDASFEQQLQRIEQLIVDLESGTLSLDDMLDRYESGMRLVAACQQRLATAELKVTEIAELTSFKSHSPAHEFADDHD